MGRQQSAGLSHLCVAPRLKHGGPEGAALPSLGKILCFTNEKYLCFTNNDLEKFQVLVWGLGGGGGVALGVVEEAM